MRSHFTRALEKCNVRDVSGTMTSVKRVCNVHLAVTSTPIKMTDTVYRTLTRSCLSQAVTLFLRDMLIIELQYSSLLQSWWDWVWPISRWVHWKGWQEDKSENVVYGLGIIRVVICMRRLPHMVSLCPVQPTRSQSLLLFGVHLLMFTLRTLYRENKYPISMSAFSFGNGAGTST